MPRLKEPVHSKLAVCAGIVIPPPTSFSGRRIFPFSLDCVPTGIVVLCNSTVQLRNQEAEVVHRIEHVIKEFHLGRRHFVPPQESRRVPGHHP